MAASHWATSCISNIVASKLLAPHIIVCDLLFVHYVIMSVSLRWHRHSAICRAVSLGLTKSQGRLVTNAVASRLRLQRQHSFVSRPTLLTVIGRSLLFSQESGLTADCIVYVSQKGNTPLHTAALAGKVDVAKILIDAGSNVNVQSQVLYCCAAHNFLLCCLIHTFHWLLFTFWFENSNDDTFNSHT